MLARSINPNDTRIIVIISLLLTTLFIWLNTSELALLRNTRQLLETPIKDSRLITGKSKSTRNQTEIAIVDIDPQSLETIGPWPWPRYKTQHLVNKLINANALLIAFDLVFDHDDPNSVKVILERYEKTEEPNQRVVKILTDLIPQFANDEKLANQLKDHEVVLGFNFHDRNGASRGSLPTALLIHQKIHARAIPKFNNFTANNFQISKASKHGGFINIPIEHDGKVRRVPLVLQYGQQYYSSLALEIVRVRQLSKKLTINTDPNDALQLKSITLDELNIPVNADGSILFTAHGKRGKFPIFRASDLMTSDIKPSDFENKIVILGSSVPTIRSLLATPAASNIMSAQIHAQIVSSLLSGQLVSTPLWLQRLDIIGILITGLLLALLAQKRLRTIIFVSILLAIIWLLYSVLLYRYALTVSALAVPILLIGNIATVNLLFKNQRLRYRLTHITAFLWRRMPTSVLFSNKDTTSENLVTHDRTVMFVTLLDMDALPQPLLGINPSEGTIYNICLSITRHIEQQGGELIQYTGHSLLALWPSARSEQAVQAALAIVDLGHKALQNGRTRPRNEAGIKLNVSIATGPVRLRTMSMRTSMVCGYPVDIASRLLNLMDFYHIGCLVAEGTKELCPGIAFAKIDHYQTGRNPTPIAIHEPIANFHDLSVLQYYELSHYDQALNYMQLNDKKNALNAFNKILRLNPKKSLYKLYITRLQQEDGDADAEMSSYRFLNRRA